MTILPSLSILQRKPAGFIKNPPLIYYDTILPKAANFVNSYIMPNVIYGGKMVSYIFAGMIVLSFVYAAFSGNMAALAASVTDGAKEAVELLVTLCGIMCMWSGFMEIANKGGLTKIFAKIFSPLIKRLFPDVSEDSEAFSYITMNMSANLLGLGNAATPLGLSAMRELKGGRRLDTATDSMVTFVVLNTASIQLLPTTVASLRASYGSKSPFDVIFCVWISSLVSVCVGLFFAKTLKGRA